MSPAVFKVHYIAGGKSKKFDLTIPRNTSRVPVMTLLSAIAEYLKCDAGELELKQGRALTRSGDPVVEITSGIIRGIKFSTENGTELSYNDVERHESLILGPRDIDLMIPAKNRKVFVGVRKLQDRR